MSIEESKEIIISDGFDNIGNQYQSIEEFWALIDERNWYLKLNKYWKNQKGTIDDMLGGMSKQIHKIDIETSISIIKEYWPINKDNKDNKNNTLHALDCGAGIGRITQFVLNTRFDKIDLIEINPEFCKICKEKIGDNNYFGNIYNVSLHEFIPKSNYYQCIWCQWTLEHLTDEDLVKFLKNCKKALNKLSNNSYCVFKENVCRNNLFYVNINGSSIIRHETVFQQIFKQSGLNIVKILDQKGFPKDLWPQKIFILN